MYDDWNYYILKQTECESFNSTFSTKDFACHCPDYEVIFAEQKQCTRFSCPEGRILGVNGSCYDPIYHQQNSQGCPYFTSYDGITGECVEPACKTDNFLYTLDGGCTVCPPYSLSDSLHIRCDEETLCPSGEYITMDGRCSDCADFKGLHSFDSN
mmetsp:Transcript_8609/g.13331  ORF Transcript_8609/g.13331 Transcript_8609/m.13331 type:complete len:155 (+) Transcript_8609:1238-1702(+)